MLTDLFTTTGPGRKTPTLRIATGLAGRFKKGFAQASSNSFSSLAGLPSLHSRNGTSTNTMKVKQFHNWLEYRTSYSCRNLWHHNSSLQMNTRGRSKQKDFNRLSGIRKKWQAKGQLYGRNWNLLPAGNYNWNSFEGIKKETPYTLFSPNDMEGRW